MISVIIPALDEARRLPGLLEGLLAEPVDREIIVVDGGSTDGTVEVATRPGVRVLRCRPGRGQQLVAGIAEASGDILLFLHADCRFPAGGLAAIDTALQQHPDAIGGNFRLLFDGGDDFARWLDGFYARIRARGIYYGDSGIFIRRAAHDRIGGLKPLTLMEDFEFVRRMERAGRTLCIEDPPLVTSSRRFKGRHPVRIVVGWLFIHALYYLGMPPDLLARLYRSRRTRPMPRT